MDVFLYARHTPWTDPGRFASLYEGLPDDVPALCALCRNVLLHNWEAARDRLPMDMRRRGEIELRPIARLLERLVEVDDRPLTQKRGSESLLVVDCRHFSTLLCSLLRHRRIPARVRLGFAQYIASDESWQMHAICEWWDKAWSAWRFSDPDINDPDVARDAFRTADVAWRLYREGTIDPRAHGCGSDWSGPHVLAVELVRDIGARTGFEPLYGDTWGLAETLPARTPPSLTDDEAARLDAAARVDGAELARVAAMQGLGLEDTVHCRPYTRPGVHETLSRCAEAASLAALGVTATL